MKMVRLPLAADTSTAAPSEPFCFLAACLGASSYKQRGRVVGMDG